MEEVRVKIDSEGNVELTVLGVAGPRCLEISRTLETLLGGGLTRALSSEYYQAARVGPTRNVKERA